MQVGAILGCRHGGASWRRLRTEAGAVNFGIYCDDCRRWVSQAKGYRGTFVSKNHPDLTGIDLETIPFLESFLTFRLCEWCGETRLCEAHHPAPKKLFGEIAETFPLIYLCRPCHEQWHGVVTPGLCTPYDAVEHVALLRRWLSRDQLRSLAIALHRSLSEAA